MEKLSFVRKNDRERLGKFYFKKALGFTLNKEFEKAYEFFKEGLDFVTCDCGSDDWIDGYKNSHIKLFNDIENSNFNHKDYFFCKAFILSYYSSKKELYLGLDSIDKYLNIAEDEYGYYVKGRILLALKDFEGGLGCFLSARNFADSPRLKYRIGRTKEQSLEQYGLDELYSAFLLNPSSGCCGRVLKKFSTLRSIEIKFREDFEGNVLIESFNQTEDEMLFQSKYEDLMHKEESQEDYFTTNENDTVKDFLDVLEANSELFITDEEETYYDEYDDEVYDAYSGYGTSYDQYGGYNGYSDDVINDAFEGDPTLTWNID